MNWYNVIIIYYKAITYQKTKQNKTFWFGLQRYYILCKQTRQNSGEDRSSTYF